MNARRSLSLRQLRTFVLSSEEMAAAEPRLADVQYPEIQCKSALNPVKSMFFGWSLNPYTGCEHRCAFCYVRAFERRADGRSDGGYGSPVRDKVNVAGVLRGELSRRSWRREAVVVGAATDPYQPAEGRYKLTRQCLQALRDFSNPTSMITRGPMIVRDIDVLTDLARRADLHISVSIPTVDDDIWRRTEPGTAHPRQRLRAIEKLVAAGIDVGVGMAPILPGLSDRPEGIEAVVNAAGTGAARPPRLAFVLHHAKPDRRTRRQGRRLQEDGGREADGPVLQARHRKRRRKAVAVPARRLRKALSLSLRDRKRNQRPRDQGAVFASRDGAPSPARVPARTLSLCRASRKSRLSRWSRASWLKSGS